MKKSTHKFLVTVDHKAGYPVYYTHIAVEGSEAAEVWQIRNWIIQSLAAQEKWGLGNYFDEVYQIKILKRIGANRYEEVENVYTDGTSFPIAKQERAKFSVFDYEISKHVTRN